MLEFYLRIFLVVGLIFVGLFWLITSPHQGLKHYLSTLVDPKSWITSLFQLLPVLQIVLQLFYGLSYSWPTGRFDTLLQLVGFIIFNAGLILASAAKIEMGSSWGAPAQHNIKIQKKLIISGPYSYSRNPIYLGLLLVFTGFELAVNSYLIIMVIPLFLYELYLATSEEKLLAKYFGKSYLDYKRRVPRFFALDKFLNL